MKIKTLFYCTECGNELPKWAGQCPACHAWNTIVERPAEPKKKTAGSGLAAGAGRSTLRASTRFPKRMDEVETTHELRFETGMNELDRVLGGGAVKGSLVLVGGAPGIGKSTLMLQICDHLCRFSNVLYVSGEESERQIKLRAERLHIRGEGLYLLSETNLEDVVEAVQELKPDILIVDSIQTLYNGDLSTAPGSVGQVKDCTMALMQLAKGQGITIFVIGHVNKEGSIAGPKVLEHMVDCVLYFEGEQQLSYRILRAAKNRFGATNEIGVFEMADDGLAEVPNPSEMLLAGRPQDTQMCIRDSFYSIAIKDGQTLELDDKTLEFIVVPNLHWPDTMYTYIRQDKTLITCDSFGSHYAMDEVLASRVTDREGYLRATKYYFDCIIGPYKAFMLDALKRVRPLDVDMICPGHGPVLDTDITWMLDTYEKWSTMINPNHKPTVIIPYVSAYGYTGILARAIEEGIRSCGDIDVRAYDMVEADTTLSLIHIW